MCVFFFNDTATTEIYTLSLHDALPISILWHIMKLYTAHGVTDFVICLGYKGYLIKEYFANYHLQIDRKSTRLNSSHANISYAVFCLKKNKTRKSTTNRTSKITTLVMHI